MTLQSLAKSCPVCRHPLGLCLSTRLQPCTENLARRIRLPGLFLNHLMECKFVCFSATHVRQKQPFPAPMQCAVQFCDHTKALQCRTDRATRYMPQTCQIERKQNHQKALERKRKLKCRPCLRGCSGQRWPNLRAGALWFFLSLLWLPKPRFHCPNCRESAFKQKRSLSLCINVSKWIICFLQVPSQPQAKVERASRRLQAFEAGLVVE